VGGVEAGILVALIIVILIAVKRGEGVAVDACG
jgi:hypothetical protein